MNGHALLRQQFERLARDPSDSRLLKQLACELGATLVRRQPEAIEAYRNAASLALRACEEAGAVAVCAALTVMIDAATTAWEATRGADDIPVGSRWVEVDTGRAITILGRGPDSPWWRYEDDGTVWHCCETDFSVWGRFRQLPDVLTETL